MNRYYPYFKYLRVVRWQFVGGVLAGLVYALASGLGMPLMVDVVFPVLFKAADKGNHAWYSIWMTEMLGSISHERLLFLTCLWIPLIFLFRAVASYTNSYLIQYVGQRVLEDIGAGQVHQILVYNKCDLLEESRRSREPSDWIEVRPGVRHQRVFVSAATGQGLAELRQAIAQHAMSHGTGGLNPDGQTSFSHTTAKSPSCPTLPGSDPVTDPLPQHHA